MRAMVDVIGKSAVMAAEAIETIAEQAIADPQFSTLVAALTAADLVGPFDSCDDPKTTVFAPTNDAFAAWQAACWTQVAIWLRVDMDSGKTLAAVPLPASPSRHGRSRR